MSDIRFEQTKESVAIDTGAIRLGFEVGLTVVMTELAPPSTRSVLADLGGVGDLWKVSLVGPDGTSPAYPTTWGDFAGAEFDKASGVLTLRWKLLLSRKGAGEVQMRIGLEQGSAITRWGLRVQLPEGWKVTKVEYPMIPGLRTDQFPKAAVPTGWGAEYDLSQGATILAQ